MSKEKCLFCDIIHNNTTSYKVYEDTHIIVILDRYPISKGHSLLIPKIHKSRVENLSIEDSKVIFSVLIRILPLILKVVGADGSTIGINDGFIAGQVVPHVHMHIIPRFKNDGGGNLHSIMNSSYSIDNIELNAIADKMRNQINTSKWD